MPTLTFHGGVDEIGGNKILLETKKSRVWLDFGTSFSKMNMFYAEFIRPRTINGIGDFIEMGLTPWLKGLYRNDYVKQAGLEESKPMFDGVFITHPHADHFGDINLLHKNIPVFMGECTKTFIESYETTGMGKDYINVREAFTGLHHSKNPKVKRNIKTFRTGDKINVNDISVQPVHVDHSIPGSYGFIVECSNKNIVYTGDIRLHGPKGAMTREFVEKAKGLDPDVLIIEGTRITEEKTMTEEQVLAKIKKIMADTKGLVIGNFPARDIDRFMTFYTAAKETGRTLLVDLKQAYLIKQLESDPSLSMPRLDDRHLFVYYRKKLSYSRWEKELIESCRNLVEAKDIAQKESVLYCNSFSMGELIDVRPVKNSSYIYSLCAPFNEEMQLDYKRLMNWVNHFNLDYYEAHASGHASPEELAWVIEEINAKKLIPVHTEDSRGFKKFTKKITPAAPGEKINV